MKVHLLLKLAGIYVFGIFLSSCGSKSGPPAAPSTQPVQVQIHIAENKPFSTTIKASGTVLAFDNVELKPEISGRITKLDIAEGSIVSSGALLAKLNDEDLQAQLKKYASQLSLAEKTRDRLKNLLSSNGVNQQEFDVAENTVLGLKADIDFVNAQIRKTEIRAPFTGIIGLRQVSSGAYVTPLQTIATLQSTDQLKLDFVIPEGAVKLERGAVIDVETGNGTHYEARVLAVEPQIDQATRNMKVRALFKDQTTDLQPGTFVSVNIESKRNDSAILIPTQCIIPESRNKKVAVIHNNKVRFQIIETGARTDSSAEVLSGLNPGDSIAMTGLLFLKPDASVIIRNNN
jgi:membrane fusion protein (multidrug efflux system)